MALNHITSGEVLPLVDEMASHRNMRIRTVSLSRRESMHSKGVKPLGSTVAPQRYLWPYLQLLQRYICILPAATKVMTSIILEGIKEHLETLIDRKQASFRSGCPCIDYINSPQIILEQCPEFRISLHLLAIDFQKAFDGVNRVCIWSALRRSGSPEKLIAIISAAYDDIESHVLRRGEISEDFELQVESARIASCH